MIERTSIPPTVTVTDQTVNTTGFSEQWHQQVCELAEELAKLNREAETGRTIVAIGGASGSSKSTTAAVLQHLLTPALSATVVHVTLDGYHYPRSVLREQRDICGDPLLLHKGRFDTYDTPALQRDLALFSAGRELAFPTYSRGTHDPVPEAIPCATGNAVLILEGLWLLFDATPWREIANFYYDRTIFFDAPAATRAENTITRHARGGRARADSERYYEENDAKNAELIRQHVIPHDRDVFWEE